jgi:hypothetical protein
MALSPPFLAAEDQAPNEVQNAISIDVFTPFVVGLSYLVQAIVKNPDITLPDVDIPVCFQYQRVLSDHFVLLALAGLTCYSSPAGWGINAYPQVGIDWHPFHKGLKGFHVGLSGDFVYNGYWATEGSSNYYRTGLELTAGWQFLLPSNLIIDLALGIISINYSSAVDINGVTQSGFWLGDPMESARSGIYFGFRF